MFPLKGRNFKDFDTILFSPSLTTHFSSILLEPMVIETITKFMMGSNVDKPSKILIKTWNAVKYIKSNIQNIEAPRNDNHII